MVSGSGGFSSANPFRARGPQVPAVPRGGGGGGSSGGGRSTIDSPTPSASELYGSASEREAQISAFRSGGQSAFQAEVQRAKQAEAQRLAEAEARRQAEAEKVRIENLRKAILQKGAQERAKILMNKEGERVRQTTTEIRQIKNGKSTNALVWKYENLDTGEVRYRSYEAPKGGGGRQLSGGVDMQTPRQATRTSGRPVSSIEAFQRQRGGVVSEALGLGKLSQSIRDYRNKLRTKLDRGQINSFQESQLLVTGFVAGLADSVIGVVDLPQTLNYLRKNPAEIKRIPSQIKDAGNNFAYLVRTSPTEAIGYIGGTLVAFKGTDVAIRSVSRVGNKALTRLNPKFVGEANIGSKLKVKVAPGRTVDLRVVAKIPKQTFAQQINLAGKRVTAISSQADDLFGLLRSRKTVRKPIPGEAKFNVETKRLLRKFDTRRINREELSRLNQLIKKQGAKGLLERTFFADPSGKIRPSRLGITQEQGSIFDLLSGDVTFRRGKPQIFLFDDIVVSKFPKSLQPVANKIKSGRPISRLEADRLLAWQLKQSGRFKPLGFITGESEIVLAPGEILRKTKRIGVTIVNGRRVPIFKVEVFRPKGITKTLLDKLNKGKITSAERNRLKRLLEKQTGINYASSYRSGAKYINIKYIGYSSTGRLVKSLSRTGKSSRVVRSPRSIGRGVSRISSSPRSRRTSSPRGRSGISRMGSSRLSRGRLGRSFGGSSRSYRGVPSKNIPPRIVLQKGFTSKTLSKKVPTFYVVEKVRGKFKKLFPKPLTLKDARDYAVYSIDNNLSRTAFFVPLGRARTVVRPPKNIQNYYSRNSQKVRPYRIRFGKRRMLVRGFIEKRRFFNDTPGERRQIKRSISPARRRQLIKQLEKARAKRFGRRVPIRSSRPMRRSFVRRPVRRSRRISSSQRRILIARLKKARAVRMRNLRRRR